MDPITPAADALTQVAALAGPALASAPMSGSTLAMMAGLVASHLAEPHTDSISPKLRPLVAVAGPGVAAALTAMSSGTDWRTAAGYGFMTSATAIASHWTFFSSTGFSSFMAGAIKALNAPKQ